MAGHSELITTAELADILTRPELRLFDCTTYLEPAPAGSAAPYIVVSGRQTFEAGHIPGANFLDLQAEFSDPRTELRFMMPPTAQLEAAFGRHGISANSRVVLYSIGTAMWATRFWWMLHALGFEGAAVLDGGIDKWTAEGRDIERALSTLVEEQRSVLLLVMLEGMSYREVADIQGVPIGTVMSRLARARAHVRASIEGQRPALRRVK